LIKDKESITFDREDDIFEINEIQQTSLHRNILKYFCLNKIFLDSHFVMRLYVTFKD